MGPSGPVSLWFFRKVGYFQIDFEEEKKGPGMTGKDRGKGLSLILTMIGHPQIIIPKLLQSLSGLLSSSMKSCSGLQVLPFFCATCNVARVSEPQAIFTRNKNDLFQKLIAFQKRDGHTYNANCQFCPRFNAHKGWSHNQFIKLTQRLIATLGLRLFAGTNISGFLK